MGARQTLCRRQPCHHRLARLSARKTRRRFRPMVSRLGIQKTPRAHRCGRHHRARAGRARVSLLGVAGRKRRRAARCQRQPERSPSPRPAGKPASRIVSLYRKILQTRFRAERKTDEHQNHLSGRRLLLGLGSLFPTHPGRNRCRVGLCQRQNRQPQLRRRIPPPQRACRNRESELRCRPAQLRRHPALLLPRDRPHQPEQTRQRPRRTIPHRHLHHRPRRAKNRRRRHRARAEKIHRARCGGKPAAQKLLSRRRIPPRLSAQKSQRLLPH